MALALTMSSSAWPTGESYSSISTTTGRLLRSDNTRMALTKLASGVLARSYSTPASRRPCATRDSNARSKASSVLVSMVAKLNANTACLAQS